MVMSFRISQARQRAIAGVLVLGAATFCLSANRAMAVEPHWPAGPYRYITVDQPVDAALAEFGRNTGIPVKLGKEIKGRLSGGMPIGTAREFLSRICNRYGLVWHFDGSALNIVPEAEMRTELMRLDDKAIRSVGQRLDTLGITDPRFPIRVSEGDNMLSVSGPPSYVALVKKALGVMSQTQAGPGGDAAAKAGLVRVFRGRRADAQEVPAAKPQSGNPQ